MNETPIVTPAEKTGSPQKSAFRKVLSWLWNPFNYTAGWTALFVGAFLLVITSLVGGLSKTHFDGVLDTHTGLAVPMWFYVYEGLVDWLSLAVVLLVAGYIVAGWKRFRAIDLFGTQALARLPLILSALVCLVPGYQRFSEAMLKMAKKGNLDLSKMPMADLPWVLFVTAAMILATVWFVAMAWKSYRVSCGVKGGKAILAFVIGVVVAEVISKVAIVAGLKLFL